MEDKKYYMDFAIKMSKMSKDPNTKVGSVISSNALYEIVSVGINHFPRRIKEGEISWRREGYFEDTKYAYVIHAEADAILGATLPLIPEHEYTLYTTMFPCNECAKLIARVGINKVVYLDDKYHELPAWVASRKLLKLAGIEFEQYE